MAEKIKMVQVREGTHKDLKFYASQEEMTMMDFVDYLLDLHEEDIEKENDRFIKNQRNAPSEEKE